MNQQEVHHNQTYLTIKAITRYFRCRKLPKALGKRCIIAGNGPSLADQLNNNLTALQNEPVFTVNFFPNSQEFNQIKPTYHALMDPVFSVENIPTRYKEQRASLYHDLNTKTDWDLHLFYPMYPGQMMLEESLTSPHLTPHICNLFPAFSVPFLRNYIYQTGLLLPPVQNVLVATLFLCLNMGYREIYLLGAEHSWTRDMIMKDDNRLHTVNRHFSGESTEVPWKKARSEDTWKMHEILKALHRTFRSYWLIQDYAAHLGATIYNSTPDSFIDAFERRDISSLSNGNIG